MIAYFAMRASPARAAVAQLTALVCGLAVATGAAAQYRYLILDAPVDQPQAMDPDTLELQGEGITYDVDTPNDDAWATWTLDAPPPELKPGPPPSSDPYAPKFEHNLPWPEVLDKRPAGPQSVQAPPVAAPAHNYSEHADVQLPAPPLPPQPDGPQVLSLPDALSEYDDNGNSWALPEPETSPESVPPPLAYAPANTSIPAPSPAPASGMTVIVDRQIRGIAPLRVAADGVPMLSVQTLEALRLPVPASAVRRGFATPDDLAQSYAYAFDAAGQMLVLTSLAPPAFDDLGGTDTWVSVQDSEAAGTPPAAKPLGAPATSPKSTACTPKMHRGRNTGDCR